MKPVPRRDLGVLAIGLAVAAFLLVRAYYGDVPPLRWWLGLPLAVLAVAEALGAREVEVAYVFLERPDEPALTRLGPDEMAAARASLEGTISRIGRGDFPVAPTERRDWSLCRGCPALRGLCGGPSED